MPSVKPRISRPALDCQRPALSAAFSCGMRRIEAMISPHVSSAAAWNAVIGGVVEQTRMPRRVQASMSMCG
jgi:hypothetical protein